MRPIGAHLLRREMQAHRNKAVRLKQETSGADVVDAQIARGFLDERHLRAVGAVVLDGGDVAFESKVHVESGGELHQSRPYVGVEEPTEDAVGDDAEDAEQQPAHQSRKHGDACAQRQCHDGVSVSIYPTPRTVCISWTPYPRSILLRS